MRARIRPGAAAQPPPPSPPSARGDGGFVLVFDHRFVFKDVPGGARVQTTCPECRSSVTLVEKRPYRQFVLSWIPLWKVRQGEHCLECPQCKARFEVPEELRPRRKPPVLEEEPEGPSL